MLWLEYPDQESYNLAESGYSLVLVYNNAVIVLNYNNAVIVLKQLGSQVIHSSAW